MASSASALDFVNATVQGAPVVVFSKTYCPYCTKAKRALASVGAKDYVLLELDEREDGAEIQKVLAALTGASSVPRVFVGGKCIGGGDDTAALAASGKLKTMLVAAGALA